MLVGGERGLKGGHVVRALCGLVLSGFIFLVVEAPVGCGGEPTDIPEDLGYDPNVTVTTSGARRASLFCCVRDTHYEDNTDDNGDFGVNVYLIEWQGRQPGDLSFCGSPEPD
jgi:hypothetical protein